MHEENQTENNNKGRSTATTEKYLAFTLAGEGYGIPILKVKEIIGLMHLTELPQSPSYIKGVINLRDHVIPIIDLKEKFAMPSGEYNERTCIIILETESVDGKSCCEFLGGNKVEEKSIKTMGVIVDGVSEVCQIHSDQIEPPPSLTGDIETQYISGIGKTKEGIKILLDIDRTLSG